MLSFVRVRASWQAAKHWLDKRGDRLIGNVGLVEQSCAGLNHADRVISAKPTVVGMLSASRAQMVHVKFQYVEIVVQDHQWYLDR